MENVLQAREEAEVAKFQATLDEEYEPSDINEDLKEEKEGNMLGDFKQIVRSSSYYVPTVAEYKIINPKKVGRYTAPPPPPPQKKLFFYKRLMPEIW